MNATDFGQLLKDHPEMLDDSKKFAAILRDIYPREKGNVNLMITACSAGVVPMLRKSELDSLLTSRIMTVLMDDYNIAESKARWAAELWEGAYYFFQHGTLRKEQPAPSPKPEAKPKPQAKPENTRQPAPVQQPVRVRVTSSKHFQVEETDSGCVIKRYIGPAAKQIVIPTIINGKQVTEIGDSAFRVFYYYQNCSSLTSIRVPDSVKVIGASAFRDCSGLTSINIPDSVEVIGDYAFCGCSSLTNLTIPAGVTQIEPHTFFKCTSLTSVELPKSIIKISGSAFEKCSGLRSITLPDGVANIWRSAFEGCTSLVSITIPENVDNIYKDAFKNCGNLTSVKIRSRVTTIGEDAFNGCPKLTIYAPAGSHADSYAKQNKISFRVL